MSYLLTAIGNSPSSTATLTRIYSFLSGRGRALNQRELLLLISHHSSLIAAHRLLVIGHQMNTKHNYLTIKSGNYNSYGLTKVNAKIVGLY